MISPVPTRWLQWTTAILGLVALLLTVLVISRFAMAGSYGERLASVTARLAPAAGQDAAPEEKSAADKNQKKGNAAAEEAAERISRTFAFVPQPPQQFRNVEGVLGDRVIFAGGSSAAVGESFGGAKITAIGPDWVDLEFEGKTITIGVFGGKGSKDRKTP